MLSDWGLSLQDMGSFPDDDDITDAQTIRQWWYVYLFTLKQPSADMKQLNEVTAECERRGIVKEGRPMVRTGAEDLASQCDEELKKRRNQFGASV